MQCLSIGGLCKVHTVGSYSSKEHESLQRDNRLSDVKGVQDGTMYLSFFSQQPLVCLLIFPYTCSLYCYKI